MWTNKNRLNYFRVNYTYLDYVYDTEWTFTKELDATQNKREILIETTVNRTRKRTS